MKKLISIFIVSAIAATMIVGCGSPEATPEAGATPAAASATGENKPAENAPAMAENKPAESAPAGH